MTRNPPDVWLGQRPKPTTAAPEPGPSPARTAGGDKPTPPTPANLDQIHQRRLEAAGITPKEITK